LIPLKRNYTTLNAIGLGAGRLAPIIFFIPTIFHNIAVINCTDLYPDTANRLKKMKHLFNLFEAYKK
jgi:hypothetical protein